MTPWQSLLVLAATALVFRGLWARDIRARLAAERRAAEWRDEATAWRDHARSVEDALAAERGAHQDELALARHHRAAARQGLRCTWGRGVTNKPETS